ncbi:MAG: N-acetylglucosamine-6-phosphate deacetylase [Acidimicrobiales bacterium]
MTAASSYLICGGHVLTATGWQVFDLSVTDGVITDESAGGGDVIDVTGLCVVPGFIDLQINGGWGYDFQREPSALWVVGQRLVELGVTSFLPTLTTDGFGRRREAQSTWRAGPPSGDRYTGADAIGWHLEGPWLAPSRHGAHRRELLQGVPARVADDITPEAGVRLVTLAPELVGALDVIAQLVERGVIVSCGHTEATGEQALDALAAGATMGTHVFNAMPPLHHRNVWVTATILQRFPNVGLIADGIHLAPEMIDLVWRVAGDRVVAVSDAVALMGTGAANAPAEAARLGDGTLAGTTVGLDAIVRNLMAYTGCGLAAAVHAVTEAPARCLGLTDRGRIELGRRADLVALTPVGEVVLTFVAGRLVWDGR